MSHQPFLRSAIQVVRDFRMVDFDRHSLVARSGRAEILELLFWTGISEILAKTLDSLALFISTLRLAAYLL